ncbi:AAA family ATPase, partial [Paenibacillus sp. P46E]|uniref:AAA family ATPase n=1 Tax=Paenibacillus sp. P46E TaxID=1349436 RepID=UPI000B2FB50E
LRDILKSIIYSAEDYESYIINDFEVFEFLMKAAIPKDFKTIKKITIHFNNNLMLESLSEGEKKQLILKLVFSVLSDKNSVILLDEPDAFLHPSWQKSLVKDIVEQRFFNQLVLLTTHSANVLSNIEKENLFYASEGKFYSNDKSTFGRDINSLQFEILGEDFRNNAVSLELREIYDLIHRRELDLAEQQINLLADEKMGHNDLEITRIKTMIDFEREFK